jgi:hypothetical protein
MKFKDGHQQSTIREAFQEWLDQFGFAFPQHIDNSSESITLDGEVRTGQWLIGQLWNCTDTLPSAYCDQLEITKGSSYANAARNLKRFLRK